MDKKLHMHQMHALTAQKANDTLGFIKRGEASREREVNSKGCGQKVQKVIFSLSSALVRLHPDYCAPL